VSKGSNPKNRRLEEDLKTPAPRPNSRSETKKGSAPNTPSTSVSVGSTRELRKRKPEAGFAGRQVRNAYRLSLTSSSSSSDSEEEEVVLLNTVVKTDRDKKSSLQHHVPSSSSTARQETSSSAVFTGTAKTSSRPTPPAGLPASSSSSSGSHSTGTRHLTRHARNSTASAHTVSSIPTRNKSKVKANTADGVILSTAPSTTSEEETKESATSLK